jgi:hypothetical protein
LSNRVTNAFHRAARDYLVGLADDADRRRFFDAARLFLARDPYIKKQSRAKRAALLHANIQEYEQELHILVELNDAVSRLSKGPELGDGTLVASQQFEVRRSMAEVIVGLVTKGFEPGLGAAELRDAALALRELDRAAELSVTKENAKKRGYSPPLRDQAHMKWVQKEAAAFRKRNPHASVVLICKRLLPLLQKQGVTRWKTAESLRGWINRQGLKI